MKIRKNSEQCNFPVDTFNYTYAQILTMADKKQITDLVQMLPDFKITKDANGEHWVVFTSDCDKIEVRFDKEDGSYYNAAILHDGTEIRVNI